MGKAAISIDNLTYESENGKVFDGFSLEISRGSRFGILGPKHAGKTSLIRLLTGSLKPAAGVMEVFGFNPQTQAAEIRHRMGIMLNPPELYGSLSIIDNMEFYAWARELNADERQERIYEMLNHFGLWEKRHFMVENLVLEQRLRLGMATLFLHRPPLIFLDEPTAGLDPVTAMKVREELAALIDNRPLLTVFLVTDNQSDAERFCEQVAILYEGRIVKEGTPAELGLTSELPRLRLTGEGFNQTILYLLVAEPEISQAEIQDGDLFVTFNAGMDMEYLTGLIAEAGGKINGISWEENTSDVLASLIAPDDTRKIMPELKQANNGND